MGTALSRMLTIDKTVQILSVVVVVGDRHFNVVARQVDNRISDLIGIGLAFQQILQPILTLKDLSIEMNLQSRIQKTIIPDLPF